MNPIQFFSILKLEETKNISEIEEAYHKELLHNHPEENPQGFQLLREAYEAALEYARQAEEGQAVFFDETEVGQYMKRVDANYRDLRTRMDIRSWETLFKDEIFDSLDNGEEAVHALFLYFADHFRVEYEVFRLLDSLFDIRENREEFMEFLPEGFVDFLIQIIENPSMEMAYPLRWMEGKPEAGYDDFITDLLELDHLIYKERNFEEAGKMLKKVEAYDIIHPCLTCLKCIIYVQQGKTLEAEENIHALLKNPELAADNDIRSRCGEVLYQCGQEEEGLNLFRQMVAENYRTETSLKYLGTDALKHEDYIQACQWLDLLVRSGKEEYLQLLDQADQGLIRQHEATMEKVSQYVYADMEYVHAVCVAYGRTGAYEKGMAFLQAHQEYEEQYPRYYDTMTHFLLDANEFEKAVELIDKWIKNEENPEELKEAQLRLGRAFTALGRSANAKLRDVYYEKAKEAFEIVLKSDPEQEDARLGRVCVELENDECKKAYEEIVEYLKNHEVSYYGASLYLRAAYELEQCGDVLHYSRELIDMAPGFLYAYEMITKVYSDYLWNDYNGQECESIKTIASFYEILKEKELIQEPGIRIGLLTYEYVVGGRRESQKYQDIAEEFMESLELAQIPYTERLFISDYSRLHLEATYDLCDTGETMRDWNRMKEAEEMFHICESVGTIRILAEAQKKRNSGNALRLYERLEKRTELTFVDWLNRAEAYQWEESWAEAVVCMDKAEQLVPDYPEVYQYVARLYEIHAKARKDMSAYRTAIDKWKIYIDNGGIYDYWAREKIVEICFEIMEQWETSELYLSQLLNMPEDVVTPEDKVRYYGKMVKTQVHMRNFKQASHWNNELRKYVDSGAVQSNQKGMELYYDMQFKILDKMQLKRKLLRCYKESFNFMDSANVKNYLIRLRDYYYRVGKYKKAKATIKKLEPFMKEAEYLDAQLRYELHLAKTQPEYREVADKMMEAHDKFPHYEGIQIEHDKFPYYEGFQKDAEKIYLFRVGDVQHYYEKYMRRKDNEIFGPDASKALHVLQDISPVLAATWILGDTERLERYVKQFELILETQLGYDGLAVSNYLNRSSDALEYTMHMMIYYVTTGQMEQADQLVDRLTSLPICSFCLDRSCSERKMALALYFEAKGDIGQAMVCYEKAKSIPLCDFRFRQLAEGR